MTHSLGLESGTVRLVDYDEQWPVLFTAEVARIRPYASSLQFQHVGSTAVPGLCAKPVLDILAGHPAEISAIEFVGSLQQAGYEHRGDAGIASHQFFRRGQPRADHVHLVEFGGSLWREYLGFRDYLRSNGDAAAKYAGLKRALAAQFPHDRGSYINGKSSFVVECVHRALGAA